MRYILILLISSYFCSTFAAYSERYTFEQEQGYFVNDTSTLAQYWEVFGSVDILQDEDPVTGIYNQYVAYSDQGMQSGVRLDYSETDVDVLFIDYKIRPVATSYGGPDFFQANEFSLWFYEHRGEGYIHVSQNYQGQPITYRTGNGVRLSDSDEAMDWLRITIRIDYTLAKWDLYIDGSVATSGINIDKSNQPRLMYFFSNSKAVSKLDDVYISDDNPLFVDEDKDGLPDSWEALYGIDTGNLQDAYSDNDGDGLTNLQEYQDGRIPTLVDFDPTGKTKFYYVNNTAVDNDERNGLSALPEVLNGPKHTLVSAIEAANSGDVITLIKGTYSLKHWKAPGKNLKIRAFGNVTFE